MRKPGPRSPLLLLGPGWALLDHARNVHEHAGNPSEWHLR
jgi:hypothetical protein